MNTSFSKRIGKQKGRLIINQTAFNNMADAVNNLRNLNFSEKEFRVQRTSNGIHVSLKNPPKGKDNHFLVEPAGLEYIAVHGGTWKRYYDDQVFAIKLTCDDGVSESFQDVVRVTGMATDECYAYLELDDAFTPTTLTAKITPDDVYPLDDAAAPRKIVLAKLFTSLSSGSRFVSFIEPYWQGGDIVDIVGHDFNHQFKITFANTAAGTFYIDDGDWRRNGEIASWNNAAALDPKTDNIIPEDYSGNVYTYIIRQKSYGGDDALTVVSSGQELPDINYQYKMEELIGTITYVDGTATGIIQNIVGGIDDRIETGGDIGYETDSFGLTLFRNNNYSISLTVGEGEIRRRNIYEAVSSATVDPITTSKKIYLEYANLASLTLTTDPSLIPDSPEIKITNAFPAFEDYNSNFVKLYEVTFSEQSIDAIGGSSGLKYPVIRTKKLHSGAIYDDWVRPDGVLAGRPDDIDANPTVKGLNFNDGGSKHKGELQDYQIFEKVQDGTSFNNLDKVLPYYDVDTSYVTEKKYSIIDTDARLAGHTAVGKSIELKIGIENSPVLQLHGFNDAQPLHSITHESQLSSGEYCVLGRDGTTPQGELCYLDLTAMNVGFTDTAGSAYTADYAYSAGTAGTAYTAEYAEYCDYFYGTHNHSDHNFDYDDHDHAGIDRYVIVDGGAGRNNMSGVIGDGSSVLSIDPTERELSIGTVITVDWNDCVLNSNGLSVDWNNRQCWSSDTSMAIDWNSKQLTYATGSVTVDWGNSELQFGGNVKLDWLNSLCNDNDENQSIDWNNRNLNDEEEFLSVDWNNRNLNDEEEFLSVDWNNRKLYHSNSASEVLCWDRGDWKINFDNDNLWNGNNFKIKTGTIDVTSDSDVTIVVGNIMTATATASVTLEGGDMYLIPVDANAGTANIGQSGNRWAEVDTWSNGAINLYSYADSVWRVGSGQDISIFPESAATGNLWLGDGSNNFANVYIYGDDLLTLGVENLVTNISGSHTLNGTVFGARTSNANLVDDTGGLIPVVIDNGWIRVV